MKHKEEKRANRSEKHIHCKFCGMALQPSRLRSFTPKR